MDTCRYCDKKFSSVGSLNRHVKRVHHVETIKRTMACLSCDQKFSRRGKLINHLKSSHGQEFEENVLEFKTYEEFEAWKAEEEKRSVAMFRNIIVDRPSNNGSTTILICSRDGRARFKHSNRQRCMKSQGSRKTGHTCTSHMVINKLTNPETKIIVNYVKTHYGHSSEVQHVNLSKHDKENIAKKLAFGVSEGKIISDALDNEAGPSRLNVLNKKDVANIRSEYGVGLLGGRRHANEMVSVDIWVNEEMGKQNPCVKYYKKYGDVDGEYCFGEEDFCLIIITDAQQNYLQKYGQSVICVDSSHGLGGSDRTIQLSTALIVDEFGEGVPVAYMYCTKVDQKSYEKMFVCMRDIYGEKIKSDFFMSDMAESIYNAWKTVMGESKLRLLCSWHILQAWNRNLSKVKGSSEKERKKNVTDLRCTLRSVLFEPDTNTFEQKFKELGEYLKLPHLKEFREYWEGRYSRNATEWAYCFRQESPVTNNMHLEAMHKVIKYFHFGGRHVRRLDESISGIFQYLQQLFANKKRLQLKLRPQKKIKTIKEAHKKSFEEEMKVIESRDQEYLIKNEKSGNFYLIAKQNTEVCCSPIKQCLECKVCRHSFTCSCPNFFLDVNSICKHIHFVARITKELFTEDKKTETNECTDAENIKHFSEVHVSPADLKNDFQEEFVKLGQLFSESSDKFSTLEKSKQKEVLRFLRTARIILNEESNESPVLKNQTEKQNGIKRKISKQETFHKKVRELQKVKKMKKEVVGRGKKVALQAQSSKIFTTEVEIETLLGAPWLDTPVDHEEIV